MMRTRLVGAALVLAAGMTLGAAAAPAGTSTRADVGGAHASTARLGGLARALIVKPHHADLPFGDRLACGTPEQPGQMACQLILPAKSAPRPAGAAAKVPQGYGPASLQSAYGLSSASARRGRGETVAIVDAYNNPDLVSNLASYRRHFHLPPCGTRNGCLRVVNQSGRPGPLPGDSAAWGGEESLDLDMVSAICPQCRILLVEARSSSIGSLASAEQTAVAKGARYVSNSWGGAEFIGQDAYDGAFNHPGDAIVFAAGDSGYGPSYPADTQYVTAVGGTALTHRPSGRRGWTETVWSGTGAGCSTLEAKPSWQTADDSSPRGCLNRTDNDVAADADPSTGVAVYDTYRTGIPAPIFEVGGTSVATAIVTAIYALAGTPAKGSYPASYLYAHRSDFNDVSSGRDGSCESNRQYLCSGRRGYNGPTGVGTPNGIDGFSRRGASAVTLLDPGTQDAGVGTAVSVVIRAVDEDGAARSLAYTAKGLPAGLTIKAKAGSLDGIITGTAPGTAGTYRVTVIARDRRTRQAAAASINLYVLRSMTALAANAPQPSEVIISPGFLIASSLTAGSPVAFGVGIGNGPTDEWQYFSGADPGSAGELLLTAPGLCAGASGSSATLQVCDGSKSQQWVYLPTVDIQNLIGSVLYNVASGTCLNSVGTSVMARCTTNLGESLALPPVSLLDGRGHCIASSGKVAVAQSCAQSPQQSWRTFGGLLKRSGTPGSCIVMAGMNDGTKASLSNCGGLSGVGGGQWIAGPSGELINQSSGRCLDDTGTRLGLVQEDCYGQPGEIWALN